MSDSSYAKGHRAPSGEWVWDHNPHGVEAPPFGVAEVQMSAPSKTHWLQKPLVKGRSPRTKLLVSLIRDATILSALSVIVVLFLLFFNRNDSLSSAASPPPERDGLVSPSSVPTGGRGALSNTPQAPTPAPTPDLRGVSDRGRAAGSLPAGGTFNALDRLGDTDALVPTVSGLYLMTVDLWDEEEFRAHLADATWIDALPTIEDCRRGLADDVALDLLSDALAQERMIVQLESLDSALWTPDGERALSRMRERWNGSCVELMERLDLRSGYPYWSTVWEEYEAWSEGE